MFVCVCICLRRVVQNWMSDLMCIDTTLPADDIVNSGVCLWCARCVQCVLQHLVEILITWPMTSYLTCWLIITADRNPMPIYPLSWYLCELGTRRLQSDVRWWVLCHCLLCYSSQLQCNKHHLQQQHLMLLSTWHLQLPLRIITAENAAEK